MTPVLSRRRALTAVVLAVAVAGVVGTASAAVAANGVVRSVEPRGAGLRISFVGPGMGTVADPGTVSVALGGRAVVPTSVRGSGTSLPDRRVMLLVDTSLSMAGAGITGARHAADAFLAAVPPDVKVGLASFSTVPTLLVPPVLDRARVRAAVGKLQASGETSLYDGVRTGLTALGTTGERRLVLLSDGADTRSTTTLAAAVGAVATARVSMNVVGFRTQAKPVADALARLAAAGRGRVVNASAAAGLATAFAVAARQIAGQLVIDVPVPADLAGRRLPVSVVVGRGPAAVSGAAAAAVMPGSLPRPHTTPPSPAASSPAPLPPAAPAPAAVGGGVPVGGLAAIFLGLFGLGLLAAGILAGRARDHRRSRGLLAHYTLKRRGPAVVATEQSSLGDSSLIRSGVGLADRVADKAGIGDRLAVKLDRAAIPLRPNEWLFLQAVTGIALLLLVALFLHNLLFAVVLAVFGGGLLPRIVLNVKANRRARAFADGLADSLQMIAGSLSAGHALPQSLDAIVRQGTEPVSGELSRALAESRLGVPIEDALDNIGTRLDSDDFRWVVMAIRVQREVGGNLAEVLETVAGTIRDRAALVRTVRALSAEGRLSAYVLLGVPIFMGLYQFLFRRDYVRPLYTEPAGIGMLLAGVVLMAIGWLVIRTIVAVKV